MSSVAKNGHGKSQPGRPLPGGYILPSLLVAGYVMLLKIWHDDMRASRMAGVDPFKATTSLAPLIATVIYLLAVHTIKHVMKDIQAFDCKPYMAVYNLYQVLLNVWCVVELAREVSGMGEASGMSFWGNHYNPSIGGFKVGFVIWIHYNNKFAELLDTLWMLLRKKDQQISFLHTYHHVLMMWAWLYVCKVECGGDAWFGAFVNSLVHVIMYLYYFLAQFGIPCPWKRYLTLIQMGQFCVCIAQSAYVVYHRNAPLGLPLAQAFVMLNMLVLFSQFYRRAYSTAQKPKKTA